MLFFFVQLWSHYLQWESDALLFIQDHLRAPALDLLFRPISALGNAGLVWIALGLALICFRKTRKTGIFLLLSLLAGLLFNNLLLKNLVARARPYEVIPGLSILCAPPGDRSFPSGHTCAAFASAGAFLWSRGWHWDRRGLGRRRIDGIFPAVSRGALSQRRAGGRALRPALQLSRLAAGPAAL